MFVDFHILNELGSPSINSNTFANRPPAGQIGRLFVSTDTFEIYRDNGTTWDLIGGPGSSTITGTGTATQVAYFTSSQAIGSSANLYWDNTAGSLGINTATPTAELDVHGTGVVAQFNTTSGTGNVNIALQRTGTSVWRIGDTYNGGANYLELHNIALAVDALQINAATNKTSWQAQQTYTTGLARGNYFDFNLSVAAGGTFSSPNAISALGASLDLTLAGNATIPSGARSGLDAYNTINFTGTGTLTQSQAAYLRAYSNITAGWAFAGSATGTITHLAGMRVLFPDNTGSAVTVTNNYALLINDQTANTGTVTYTNRWGIYQEGSSDLNYLNANLLLGSTTNTGNKLQVTGTSYFNGNVGIGISATVGFASDDIVLQINNNASSGSSRSMIRLTNGYSGTAWSNGSFLGIDNNLDFYIYNYENNALLFGTNGTEKMRISSTGNVGIGITPSAWGSTYKAIQISSRVSLAGDANQTVLANNWFTNTGGNSTYIETAFATAYSQNSGEHRFFTAPSGTAGNTISFTQAMTLTNAGNLGIGTSSPLEVTNYKGISLSGTNGSFLSFYTGSTQNARIETNTGTEVQIKSLTAIPLIFGTNNTEAFRVVSNQNFLIGTTTDAGQKLQVNGNSRIFGTLSFPSANGVSFINSSDNSTVSIWNNGTSGNSVFYINGNTQTTGSITTGNPTGGTAAAWKLGSRVAATVVVNTTQYIEVDIGGTLYKLATVS